MKRDWVDTRRRRRAKNALEDNDRPNDDNDEKSIGGEQNTREKTMEILVVADSASGSS